MPISAADQERRAHAFAELHQGPGAFVIANPWDAGTARVLTGLGFRALATTSGGLAFALGRADGANLVTREETLANAGDIVAATTLPVSADLESGFGDRPEDVAETIALAAAAGLVGGSIEDATGRLDDPIRDLAEAVERVTAAVEAARALPFPFTLTARAENFLHGRPDLDDTITRLRAYAAAGADVLYAPGLPDADAIRAVCAAVDKPVNVLAGGPAARCSVTKLGELGVRRISLGSALPRAALTAAVLAAQEIAESGTFTLTTGAMSYAQAEELVEGA
ncbi:isocitrate lyase/phosphoenolpyruvate mutase family protein [Actinokineospora auranticolor]|uniref:2-methylisocitrate lyase-like PEP mutase family enzyme n=1 Tax=Actinokineospora auranticolor TaxID=155976 RepID=A0A2S6GGW9_9PSEU|nr:isocitrate lyase/phosphoenolpyruvate mutase family protein [Actinokineospora auranticolor]PPK64453.1 2-methylisocitrate lyase-like PEP mutase family enzyme [Actinokineospora auranticolor]